MIRLRAIVAAVVTVGLATGVAVADVKIFNDGALNGLYRDANNWMPAGVPNLGGGGVNGPDSATIGGAYNVVYDATVPSGADFVVNSTFNMEGSATWTQTGGIHWIQVGQGATATGAMNLSGSSSFSTGTAQNLLLGPGGGNGNIYVSDDARLDVLSDFGLNAANSHVGVSGNAIVNMTGPALFDAGSSMEIHGGNLAIGTTSGNWEFAHGSTFYMDGGAATLGPGEFKLFEANGTLAGGDLDVGFLAFFSTGSGDGIMDVSGGTLTFDGSLGFDGFYQAGAEAYINFVPGSTGTVVVQNRLVTDVYNAYINSAAARIRADGDWLNAADLVLTQVGADTHITLVPEPASLLLLGLGGLAVLRRR